MAQGGILHLASINPGNEDSNSCNDSSLIESASVNIPQLKVRIFFSLHINPLFNICLHSQLKAIMRPMTSIELSPPLLPILSPTISIPSLDPHTLDQTPSLIFLADLPAVTDIHKLNLLNEVIYDTNSVTRMRAIRVIEQYITLSKQDTFLTFDLFIRVISRLMADRKWLLSLAESCTLHDSILSLIQQNGLVQWIYKLRMENCIASRFIVYV